MAEGGGGSPIGFSFGTKDTKGLSEKIGSFSKESLSKLFSKTFMESLTSSSSLSEALSKSLSTQETAGERSSVGKTTSTGKAITETSGKTTVSGKQFSKDQVDSIIKSLLISNKGMTEATGQEKRVGLFDATATQSLVGELLANITGKIADITAQTVTTESGTTSSQRSEQSEQQAIQELSRQLSSTETDTSSTTKTEGTQKQQQTSTTEGTQSTVERGESQELGADISKDTSQGAKCFITTAACEYAGQEDKGEILAAAREFRDTWLVQRYPDFIHHYYYFSPLLLTALSDMYAEDEEGKKEFYINLLRDFIYPMFGKFNEMEYEKVLLTYILMLVHIELHVQREGE